MSYISGSTEKLFTLLELAYEAGFSAGFHCEDNPGSYEEDWKVYLKYLKEEFGEDTDE
jgi:hypothetical protein